MKLSDTIYTVHVCNVALSRNTLVSLGLDAHISVDEKGWSMHCQAGVPSRSDGRLVPPMSFFTSARDCRVLVVFGTCVLAGLFTEEEWSRSTWIAAADWCTGGTGVSCFCEDNVQNFKDSERRGKVAHTERVVSVRGCADVRHRLGGARQFRQVSRLGEPKRGSVHRDELGWLIRLSLPADVGRLDTRVFKRVRHGLCLPSSRTVNMSQRVRTFQDPRVRHGRCLVQGR